jgi:antitoxin (DNA-binding transcriptional repressor) of toxin-antitoxin stability system
MVRATVEDITRDPAGYLRRVEAGETVLVTHADRAVAEIKPIFSGDHSMRPFGLCAGDFTVPDDFNSPLPNDVLDEFEGK